MTVENIHGKCDGKLLFSRKTLTRSLNRLSSDYIRYLIDAHRLQLHFVYVVSIIKMINVSFFLSFSFYGAEEN